jgi:ABC-type Mn2+/Zn2+ transport system permease subunit
MFGLPMHIVLPTLLGSLLAGIACSMVGTLVVRLNLSSLGFAMSHAAFAGAALGIMLSVSEPAWLAVVFSLATAALLGPLADFSRMNSDTVVGATFPLAMALGLVFLSRAPSSGIGSGALSLLWGSVLGITMGQVAGLAVVLAVVLLVLFLFGKEFLALLLNRKLAQASGINTRVVSYAVLFMVAVVVAVSMRVTGGLLIYALMILPASAAFQWVYDIKKVFLLAPALGVAAAFGGFALSLAADLPIGSAIALFAAGIFLLSTAVSPKRRRARHPR